MVGAAPAENVVREVPAPGDVVVLLGGRTGRDGCGGATGSSKAHTAGILETCGAEVQKGNAPTERKLQRLFRNPRRHPAASSAATTSARAACRVAIGELADGLDIDLDKVPKKYDGLDGTELAISESQERMAVVLAPEDVEAFIASGPRGKPGGHRGGRRSPTEPRLIMTWNGNTIVDISREFLNSNGAEKHTDAQVPPGELYQPQWQGATMAEKMHSLVSDLNVCSKKGLVRAV